MHTTHQKGLYGELSFALRLIEKGFTVLQPINPNSSYDLVAEKDGIFQKIQVKYLTSRNGVFRIELERPNRKTPSYRYRAVDSIGIYESTKKKFYLVPISAIDTATDFWLRVEKPRNNQKKRVHLAEKYEV